MKIRLLIAFLMFPYLGHAEAPLSAIDWLNKKRNVTNSSDIGKTIRKEPPTTSGAEAPKVAVSKLSETRLDAVGLLPAQVTGFPVNIWHESTSSELVMLLRNIDVSTNPAIQSLLFRLLLAEGHAPFDSDDSYEFLKARIETLVKYGAVDPALALLERAAPLPAQLVPTLFDLSMLSEALLPACEQVLSLGSSYARDAERIFCTARTGDWMTAHLMLETATALDELEYRQVNLLVRFLDAYEYEETLEELPPPLKPTPLDFRLYEAIGEPLATASLPLEFAVNDLTGDHGWKAQLEAAERLKNSGALADNRFFGIFTERPPSASGGIWEKVRLIQQFEQAVNAKDAALAGETLQDVFAKPEFKDLIAPTSRLFANAFLSMDLSPHDREAALRLALLSEDFAAVAAMMAPDNAHDALIKAVAMNDFSDIVPNTTIGSVVSEAFRSGRVPFSVSNLIEQHKLGEAILTAIIQFEKGSRGDLQDLMDSLSTLRFLGLNETAQRATLHLLVVGDHEN